MQVSSEAKDMGDQSYAIPNFIIKEDYIYEYDDLGLSLSNTGTGLSLFISLNAPGVWG